MLGERADSIIAAPKWAEWNSTDFEAAFARAEESADACRRNNIVGGARRGAVPSWCGLLASASALSLKFQVNVGCHDDSKITCTKNLP